MPTIITHDQRYYKRRIKSSMGETVVRPLLECITNSTDSYNRMLNKGEEISGEITIFHTKKEGYILDQAEGMSKEQLWKVTEKIGGKTSGIDENEPVRGHFGIGLKEGALALEKTRIITIKDGLLNEVTIFFNNQGEPFRDEIIVDKYVTEEDRNNTGIKENGTIIRYKVPKEFNRLGRANPNWVYDHLLKNIMLRKVLTSDIFKIKFINGEKKLEAKMKYPLPDGELILEKKIEIEYYDYDPFEINLKVYKSDINLRQAGEYRNGGIVLYFNQDAILDCSLFGLDHDFYAGKFFGEAEIVGFNQLLKEDEAVLSDERKGLDYSHEFCEKLKKQLFKILKELTEKEKKKDLESESDVKVPHIKVALGIINKAIKMELEDLSSEVPPPKFVPANGLGFYQDFIDITFKESKNVYLVIDRQKFHGKEIVIKSREPSVVVSPEKLNISKENDERYQKEKIELFGEERCIDIEVLAKCEDTTSSILVTVQDNPKLSIEEEIAFLGEKATVVENKEKNISLLINGIPDFSEQIRIVADEHIIKFPSSIQLETADIKQIEHIHEVIIPIKGLKKDAETKLIAKYKDNEAIILISVIEPRGHIFRGLIKGFKESAIRNPKEISSYEEGIVFVHTAHPVIQHYIKIIKKDFGQKYVDSLAYRMFRTNLFVDRICKQIALEKDRLQLLPKLHIGETASAIERESMELFFKYGAQFHNAICPLARSINIELETEEEEA